MSDENGCRDIGNKFISLSTQRQVASSITNQLTNYTVVLQLDQPWIGACTLAFRSPWINIPDGVGRYLRWWRRLADWLAGMWLS